MELVQKKFLLCKSSFAFGEKALDYKIYTESGLSGFCVSYESITEAYSRKTFRGFWLSLFGDMGFCYAIIDYITINDGFHFIVGLTSILIIYIAKSYNKAVATYLRTSLGDIMILPDSQHDLIIAEIIKRRRNAVRLLYGKINPYNHPQEEIARFRWLRDEEIISSDEFDKVYADISMQHSNMDLQKNGV